MASSRSRSRANEFDDLLESAPQDFDPEADDGLGDTSGSEDDVEDDADTDRARDHYVAVSKSKLRKPKETTLGPQYRGSRVSRDVMDEDEEDDPLSRGFDDAESGSDDLSDSGEDLSDGVGGGVGSEDEENETVDTDVTDDEQSGPDAGATESNYYAEARIAMADEQKTVAASLSQANRADAEKGRAVKRQRTGFDGLLGARMKLQKTLIGVNTVAAIPVEEVDEERSMATDAIEAAEAAAFNLWSSLNILRDDMLTAKSGLKRKRSPFSTSTPISKLWTHLQKQEEDSLAQRNATLQKWSAKAKVVSAAPARNRLNNSERETTIMDVIQEQLSNPERLMKRAHMPRSCAPVQVANKVTEDERIYDDADFYGLMLKELLEQKSQDSVMASNIDVSFQMRRKAKTRKNVDTKASKGRKLRYTVHEKLQNFMAPEDRSTWGQRQTDELFGSLFGQRLGLGEERDEDADEDVGGSVDPHEASLMLFRN